MAFTQDNQSAFISDRGGKIKIIKWTPNAKTEHDFKLYQNSTQVGKNWTLQICLTRDDKNLLVGSLRLVSVSNTETRNVIKEFEMNDHVKAIKFIGDGTNALIAGFNGNLTIINLKTMEISSSHKLAAKGKNVFKIAVI